tara:strand:- start:31 stop:414 length:384 start_codon:yes stop_codon:yes gene_type:complete
MQFPNKQPVWPREINGEVELLIDLDGMLVASNQKVYLGCRFRHIRVVVVSTEILSEEMIAQVKEVFDQCVAIPPLGELPTSAEFEMAKGVKVSDSVTLYAATPTRAYLERLVEVFTLNADASLRDAA